MGIFESIRNAFGGKDEQDVDVAVSPERAPEPKPAIEAAPAATHRGQKTYTVRSGDTLWKISRELYGNGSKYMKIFEANTGLLKSPDQIFPGQELVIPETED